jgi:hypothetical protein
MSSTFLSPDQALATLKEYESGDGLSLRELMDTRRNGQGGLTYNDFLVLPGKIDFPVSNREDGAGPGLEGVFQLRGLIVIHSLPCLAPVFLLSLSYLSTCNLGLVFGRPRRSPSRPR